MKKEPETYEELIRQKRCYDLTKYYKLTETELEQIYEFLKNNPKGKVTGDKTKLSLSVGFKVINVINAMCTASSIDGLTMSNDSFKIIPHYTPSSSYSSGSSGGFSSNNNNNNNNNN
ncbi:MAG: hypothetical protein IJ399_05290, partial [Bacilli bacterium]|nr:hypothetical protein [Bacilli bacterium]